MTASTQPAPNSRGLFWLILLLLALLVMLLIWLTIGFRLDRSPTDTPLPRLEPIAGGVLIPTSTAVAPSALADIILDGTVPTELQDLVFVPEQPVLITNQATTGSAGQMPVYAEPRLDADISNVYPAGTLLTVLEPSDEYGPYPLEIEGLSWVRVRDSSGTEGWTKAGMLYPVEAIQASQAVPIIVQPGNSSNSSDTLVPAAPAQSSSAVDSAVEVTAGPQEEPTPTSTPAG